ncbi:MAG TPA: class I adenylate-forming enzyme family protein [Thermodesulfobacteriota bacterium]|nr:class I adenylate-forming enzyme family protein [Thermodesulfobacteriota bacterium]
MVAPVGSIYEQFERVCRDFPDKPALIYLGKQYRYSQLREAVEGLAASLHRMGVFKGNKAILYLPNCPQWVVTWLALQRIGAIAVPISPIYTPVDLKYMANDSGTETIFCLDTNFGYVAQVLPETGLKRVVVTNVAEVLPWWKRLIGEGFNKIPSGKYDSGRNIFRFKDLLKGGPISVLPPLRAEPEETIEMLYTGGTTGLPKGVPFTNILFLEAAAEQRAVSERFIPKREDIVIQGGPLFHILGQQVGLGGILSGDTLVLLPRVNLDGLFDHIERYRVLTFFGVPAMYRMILEHDRVDYYDLSSLKYCFSGGDVMPPEVAERWLRKFGKPIYQGYGATETCGRVSLTPMGEQPPAGSAGKVTPLQKVRLVDPDTLEPTAPGEPGELLVSSEHMVRAYWNKPEETAECFIEMDGKLWYRTRDIVRMDQNKWLFYLDRSVDTLKHKGYRVAVSEIEAVLQEHPAVISACVVGVPDEKVGERIKAFAVLKEDVKGVNAYDLLKWCRERLAPYKVPQYIEFRDMLPKSKVGKLLRRELRAEERKRFEKE